MLRLLLSLAILGCAVTATADSLAGTWACQSMNAGPYTGRPCPHEPWLKLNADNSYEWGREKGAWRYQAGALVLSERSGKGRLNSDGKLIFEYELHGKSYVLTLYRRAQ